MNTVIAVLLALGTCALASSPDKGDLTAEASQQKIYEIIRSHENRKYGDHGGHEYEEGEVAQKQASRKRYGYLPLNAEVEAPVYYDGPASKDNIYRENVFAYAPKLEPVRLSNAPHQIISSPVSHSHYAIVDPITKNHQYVTFDAPQPQLAVYPKSPYILEEEPHYDQKLVAKPVVPHYLPPVKDYSHHLDKSHHAPGVDHYGDNGVHGESGHKSHHTSGLGHYGDNSVHGESGHKSHHVSGLGHYGDNSVHGESGHKNHKKHEISGHKSHSASGGHHDEHDHHHNRAHYERDRGYHYEKAYAYDRIRAHHDIGSNKASHSGYRAHHSQEGHKDSGSQGAHGYSYFKKQDKAGGQGYRDHGLQYLSPHPHAYGK